MRPGRTLFLAGSFLLLVACAAAAAPTPAQRCQAAKLAAAFGDASARVACFRSDVPTPKRTMCINGSEERREQRFAKADARGGCVTTGDSADVGAAVFGLANDLQLVLPLVTSPSRCSTTQFSAAASALGKIGRAYVRDARSPDPVWLATTLARVEAAFDATFARAVGYGDCLGSATADEVYAILAQGAVRIRGKLVPECGDGVRAASEACDGSDTGSCVGACTTSCTCADACGDGIVQAGEACDGTGCEVEDPNGCGPPGSSNACQCCAAASPCYVRGFGTITPVELPCCTGTCQIPGPEAGPDVMVYCTQTPQTACPCFTRDTIDAAFPAGFFDQQNRGGAVCDQAWTSTSVFADDLCVLNGPPQFGTFWFPRGGAGLLLESSYCAIYSDLDPDDDGSCNGAPALPPQVVTPEQAFNCRTELLASQPYQAECD